MMSRFVLLLLALAVAVLAHVPLPHEPQEPHYINGVHNPKHPESEEDRLGHEADFAELDENGDGRISRREMLDSATPDEVAGDELEDMFEHVDKNKDGFISKEEYMEELFAGHLHHLEPEEYPSNVDLY
eukprot:PLAT2853.1.p2 GENE.PLAT2853.1~~PLAT2853.1.p2  ORF type:complete len:129 (+),score=64.27 PLAT2853.1:2-388(+)